MQIEEEPSTLTRSDHVENLDLAANTEEEGNGAVGNLRGEEVEDGRFFDSSDHRICFKFMHVKIATFVLVTLILHQIIIGILYLLSIFEEIESKSSIFVILACRGVQLISIGLLYYGIWQLQKKFILPFIFAQPLGIFADISTLLILIRQLEATGEFLLFTDEGFMWLNVALPSALYFVFVGLLLYVLYSCYNFLSAQGDHEKRRQKDRENFGLNGSGVASFLQPIRRDSAVRGTEHSNSPSISRKTQNAIAMQSMQSLSRTPSSQVNSKATKFSAEQLKLRAQLIRQRNPTGSLQQLSFNGKPSLVTSNLHSTQHSTINQPRLTSFANSSYQRPEYEHSEPMLNILHTKNPGHVM